MFKRKIPNMSEEQSFPLNNNFGSLIKTLEVIINFTIAVNFLIACLVSGN